MTELVKDEYKDKFLVNEIHSATMQAMRPGFWESMIPIWGSLRGLQYDIANGAWDDGWCGKLAIVADVAFVVLDVTIVGGLLSDAAKIGMSVGRALVVEGAEQIAKDAVEVSVRDALELGARDLGESGLREVGEEAGREIGQVGSEELARLGGEETERVLDSNFRWFGSDRAFKRAFGAQPGEGQVWHHIVEQRKANIGKFGSEAIYNTQNAVAVTTQVNKRIADYYSRSLSFTDGKVLRRWLGEQSWREQYDFGYRILDMVLSGKSLPL